MAQEVIIGSTALTPLDVVRVARNGSRVEADRSAVERMAVGHSVMERLLQNDQPVYGLNTGLGAKCDVKVSRAEMASFQERILMARTVNVGPELPEERVRAMMFARAAGMARGGSGIQPAVFRLLVEMLNAGVHPVVRAHGSLAVSDLGPLAQMSLPLIGLGEAWFRGQRLSGAEALRQAGLSPVELRLKDGLSLCSANAATVAHGALVWHDTLELLEVLDAAFALSLEGFQGNISPLDPRVHQARPYPWQVETAARVRRLLSGSYLTREGAARKLQDPLSFRCVTQVHGAVRDVLQRLEEALELELNSAADSPLVLPEDGEAISNSNFHIPQVAIGFDSLGLALSQAAAMGAHRSMKLMTPEFSGLPAFLSPVPGASTGFATLQKTISWLHAEIRRQANPASLDYLPVANGQEDHATMASIAVAKTEELLLHLRYLTAVELMVAAQAVDLRGRPALGAGTRGVYALIREAVPPLEEDRVVGADVEAVHELIKSGRVLQAVREAAGRTA